MVSPQIPIDTFDKVVRICGWPTLICILVWAVRKWDADHRVFSEIHENTKKAVEKVAVVEQEVETLKSNHLAHLQIGMDRLATSNDKAVEVLQEISTGITVLVDRGARS